MAESTELRLEFSPDDLSQIQNSRKLRELSVGRALTRNLGTTYYDTPDGQLKANGVILEVRTVGRRYVQAIRADETRIDGTPVHREWENPLPTAEPDAAAVADLDLRRLVTPLAGTKLEPVVRCKLRRTIRRISVGEGREVDLELDVGELDANGHTEPIAEFVLRSQNGGADVFDAALLLQSEVPLRVATRDPERRAFGILDGQGPEWRKAVKLDLSAEATVEETLGLVLTHCLDHLEDNERCTLLRDHPEGVHQMRVAMRRMRSALRAFRAVLPPAQYDRVTEEVKWLTKSLADTRDLDVFMDEIAGPVAEAFAGEPSFAVLNGRLAADRETARAEARAALSSPRYTQFILETRAWVARRGWREQPVSEESAFLFRPITELADLLLAKHFKKVRKDGKKFDSLPVEEKHQLRIDVKRLRYVVDFFSSLYDAKKVKGFIKHLQRLQDGLGYMNDVAVAQTLVGRLTETATPETAADIGRAGALVLGWHAHAAVGATAHLSEDVAELISCKPFWSRKKDAPA